MNKRIKLTFFAVAFTLTFLCLSVSPVSASIFLPDPSYKAYIAEWSKSATWIGNVYWIWSPGDNGFWILYMTDNSKWNHVGVFQGSSPGDPPWWGRAAHYWDFPGIHEDCYQRLLWYGMLDYSHLRSGHWDAQTNVGVDLWFNIWHPELGWAVAELFVFFDQNGMFSHGVGDWWEAYRSADGHSWMEICHHEGNLVDDQYKQFSIDVDELIDEAKAHCSNPYYRQSTWYLCDVLNCLEGKKAEAMVYLQYLYYYVTC